MPITQLTPNLTSRLFMDIGSAAGFWCWLAARQRTDDTPARRDGLFLRKDAMETFGLASRTIAAYQKALTDVGAAEFYFDTLAGHWTYVLYNPYEQE